MTEQQRLRRVAEVVEELGILKKLPPGAAGILDRELERLVVFHTERCCDVKLTPEESASFREARALARGLVGFFEKRRGALMEELGRLRKGE
jgi:hypothetical protein